MSSPHHYSTTFNFKSSDYRFAFTVICLMCLPALVVVANAQESAGEKAKAVTAKLGKIAPDFELKDTEGTVHKLSQYKGKTVVLEWFNPDCPFVKLAYNEGKLAEKGLAHTTAGGVWLAINSGGPGLQGHGQDRNQKARADFGIKYPVLLDETGQVGRLFEAKKTPHIYVINPEGILVYAGALDSTRGAGYETKNYTDYLADALKAVSAKKTVTESATKAWGCSVKYKK